MLEHVSKIIYFYFAILYFFSSKQWCVDKESIPGALALSSLEIATKHGAVEFLKFLTKNVSVEQYSEDLKHQFLINAVMSDCPESFRTVLSFSTQYNI